MSSKPFKYNFFLKKSIKNNEKKIVLFNNNICLCFSLSKIYYLFIIIRHKIIPKYFPHL